jgi:hypothetical protein
MSKENCQLCISLIGQKEEVGFRPQSPADLLMVYKVLHESPDCKEKECVPYINMWNEVHRTDVEIKP